jgi:hypothetical protein
MAQAQQQALQRSPYCRRQQQQREQQQQQQQQQRRVCTAGTRWLK